MALTQALQRPAPDTELHGLVLVLATGTALVVLADLAVKASSRLHLFRSWFDVGLENNVPTGWSVLLLLALSARLWRLRGSSGAWRCAAAAALLLAVDEWVGWHEHLRVAGEALREVGIAPPTYAWVLPGMVVAALCVGAATPWLRSLPHLVRRRVLLAVLVFCGGALGVEALSGLVHELGGSLQVWAAITSVEEALEMLGVLLAVSAFGPPPEAAPATPLREWVPLPR